MKSSRCSDEIFGLRLQMKLNPPSSPAARQISSRSDFIHDSGFIPTKADLVEKSTHCLGRQMCVFVALNVIIGVQAWVIANKRCPNELYIILCSQHLFDNRIHKHNRRIPHREHEFFSKYQAQFLCL